MGGFPPEGGAGTAPGWPIRTSEGSSSDLLTNINNNPTQKMVLIGYRGAMHPRVGITRGRGDGEGYREGRVSRGRRSQSQDCQTWEERSCEAGG